MSTTITYIPKIGAQIKDRIVKNEIAIDDLVRKPEKFGFESMANTRQYFNNLLGGCIYGSPSDRSAKNEKGVENLKRLAAVLHEIGVAANDPLVEAIREADPRFSYKG